MQNKQRAEVFETQIFYIGIFSIPLWLLMTKWFFGEEILLALDQHPTLGIYFGLIFLCVGVGFALNIPRQADTRLMGMVKRIVGAAISAGLFYAGVLAIYNFLLEIPLTPRFDEFRALAYPTFIATWAAMAIVSFMSNALGLDTNSRKE